MNPVERIGYKFRQDLTIPCYQTDAAQFLKPAGFMDMAQEIAYWAAQELGFGYDDLQRHQTAWVLSRFHFTFQRRPRWRDTVRLYTWHKGFNGLFFLRDFELRDKNEDILVSGTSSWLVIDINTRKMVRPEDLKQLFQPDGPVDDAIAEPAPKLLFPKDAEATDAAPHTVSYSDIDILGHTNNVRYLVWAMDAIDYDPACPPDVKEVFINFNRETRPGETVNLRRAVAKPGPDNVKEITVEGSVEGKQAFMARLLINE